MKKALALIPALLLVASISGCVQGGGGLAGLMGMGVEEKEAPHDLLQIKNIKVVPRSPVRAKSDFTLSFQVKNLDEKKSAQGAGVKLYDWGRCDPPAEDEQERSWGNLFPGATKLIEWGFTAPDNEQLGYMSGQCSLRFKVNYSFDAHTRADAVVASKRKMREASRAGETVEASPTESKSRGPIKIDVRFTSSQPFVEGTVVSFDVIVQNKGSGEVSKLKNEDVEISIAEPGVNIESCKYPREGSEKNLPFIGRETPPIRCTFTPSNIGSPKKTFMIKVDIPNYEYVLSEKKTVKVEPTYEEEA